MGCFISREETKTTLTMSVDSSSKSDTLDYLGVDDDEPEHEPKVNCQSMISKKTILTVNDEFISTKESSVPSIASVDLGKDVAHIAIQFDALQLHEKIDKGIYGSVIRGTYHSTPVVVKRLSKDATDSRSIEIFREEITLMMHLQHPNIVQFIGASWDSPRNLCLVMENLQRGDLYSLLRNPKYKLSWSRKLYHIALHTARGMAYLHSMDPPIIHRDLKSKNIQISSSYVAKVSDYVVSKQRTVDEIIDINGPPLWMAPEMMRDDVSNEKSDVYSFGIVLSELDTGKSPYHEHTTRRKLTDKVVGITTLLRRVACDNLRPGLSENVPPAIRSLYCRCVDPEPSARPTFDEIIDILEFDVQQELNDRFPPGQSAPGMYWPS